MKKTMNILEFYEFLKGHGGEFSAELNAYGYTAIFYISAENIFIKGSGYIPRLTDTFTIDVPDFIPKWDDLKEVEYFGKKFLVNKYTKWLAVDRKGYLCSYDCHSEPLLYEECFSSDGDFTCICKLNYEGDWTKSLVEV